MSYRRLIALSAALALGFAATGNFVAHEHPYDALAGYECAADHDGATTGSEAPANGQLRRAAPAHRHDCPACQLHRQRHAMAPSLRLTHGIDGPSWHLATALVWLPSSRPATLVARGPPTA